MYGINPINRKNYLKKIIFTLKEHYKVVNDICFSNNCEYIATASADKTSIIYGINPKKEFEYGKVIHRFANHVYSINSISFSSCSRFFASGSWDKSLIIYCCDPNMKENGKEILKLKFDNVVQYVGFSPLTNIFVFSYSNDLEICKYTPDNVKSFIDKSNHNHNKKINQKIGSVCLSKLDNIIAVTNFTESNFYNYYEDQDIVCIDILYKLSALDNVLENLLFNDIMLTSFSSYGNYFAINFMHQGDIRIYKILLKNGMMNLSEFKTIKSGLKKINSIFFSNKLNLFAIGSSEKIVIVYC